MALRSGELEGLIARATSHNPEVAIAAARIAQARAQLRAARSAMLPVVFASARASGTRTRSASSTAGSSPSAAFDFSRSFGIDASFDPDLFGANRSSARAADARVQAAAFDAQAVRLAIESDIASAFVQAATLQKRIVLLDRNLQQARELARIVAARRDAGDASRVDQGLQTIQVQQLLADRTRLLEALDRTRTALAALVGEEAPLFHLPPSELESLAVPVLAAMQPSELVFRRPDILAAEARIRAAGGDVAAARAAFLPRMSLSASGFAQARATSPLTTILSLGANLLAPIFNRGRLRADLEFASARQVETVELYRRVLLTSLADVENGLSAAATAGRREALLSDIVQEAQLTSRLARVQYVEGEADLQQVFRAERYLVSAEDALVIARQERLEAAISLYRALGGSPAAEGDQSSPVPIRGTRS